MNIRRAAATAMALAIFGLLLYRAGAAAPAADDASSDSVAVRCARAQLQLAEVNLRKADAMNRKLEGSLSTDLIAQFTEDVEIARQHVQDLQRAGGVDSLETWIQRADLAVRLAEANLKKAKDVDQLVPGTVQPLDFQRLRLRVDIARLQLERGRSLAKSPVEARLQWQIEMLNDGLTRLKEHTAFMFQNQGPPVF